MDLITFKIQANRASQALVIQSSNITKRALLKTLYNEAIMTGNELILTDIELDDTSDHNVKSMTFGLRGNIQSEHVSGDLCLVNIIPPDATLLAIVIENETGNEAKLSFGITSAGSEIAAGVEIEAAPKLTTVTVINTFSKNEYKSVYIHHAGEGDSFNDAILNITFLFKST